MTYLRRTLWALTALYWLGIFTLTHLPARKLPRPPLNLTDKACHGLAYFGLSMLVGLTLWVTFPRRRGWLWLILAVGMGYGAIDEWLQIPVGRDCELLDWVADSAGTMLAVLILSLLQRVVPLAPTSTSMRESDAAPAAL